MKKIIPLLILFFPFTCCVAQIGDSRADMDIIFNDLTTKYFKDRRYSNVEGSPFLLEDWSDAILELTSGIKYDKLKVRIDLVKQEVVALSPPNAEMVVSNTFMKRLELVSGEKKLVFRTGYPRIEKKTATTLYNVLLENKISLLKFSEKDIVQKDEFDKRKSFILYEDYYIFYDKTITLVKGKNSFLKLFPDQSSKIDAYLSENKIKTRDEADLISLVTFINSLL